MAALVGGVALFTGGHTLFAAEDVIVKTDAYTWKGDTLYQDEFKAWAVSPEEIRSTYKGRPGYFRR